MIIEGAISVKAAIQNKKRKVLQVLIDEKKKTKDFNYIRHLCSAYNIKISEESRETLEEKASGKSFGGILAVVEGRKEDKFIKGDIFYLDGIEDPFNLAYCFRTLYALGVNNILLPERNMETMEAQLLKSSAGAYDMLNIRFLKENDFKELKKQGYYIYSLDRSEGSKDVFDVKFKDPAVFMIGGEKRGINAALNQYVDQKLYIPYGNEFRNSLNAAAALDVIATLRYERKRS